MEEASGSATLVESAPEIEAQGMTTTLPRAEVEEALRSEDGPIELFLDLLRPADDEARSVRVAWDHDDLERILEASSGETVTLAFDRQELERAFDDVEGHGLRERALVLTVAVATAAAGASVAQAGAVGGPGAGGGPSATAASVTPTGPGGTGGPISPAADVAGYQQAGGAAETPSTEGYVRAMPTDYGPGGAVGAAGEESPAEVTGGAAETPSTEGYVRAMPSDYGPGGAVGAAGDQAPAEVTGGAGEPAGGAVGASGGEAPAAVTGAAGQPEFVPGVTDFPSYPVQEPQQQPAGEGTGISIPEPAQDAAIAGGIALLITAAGFAVRGQRRRIERPA
jgi:hypothetical protein